MKITQEKLPASQVGLDIEVPSETAQQSYDRVIQQFTRSLNIPGFRKGKVPRHVLLQRLGSAQIKQAVLDDLIQKSLKQALDETQLVPLATPDLKISFENLVQHYELGSAFSFGVIFDVKPNVTLNVYQGFEVQAEEVQFEPSKVDDVLEQYRIKVATWIPVEDRPAQRQDAAIVDYHGRITDVDSESDPDAAEFPGNQDQNFQVELEEGRFVDGFIEGIIGMGIGESKDVVVQFPADYPLEKVAGHTVTFSITLKELKERELPDVDDDFAKDISEFETLEELRASLTERYELEAQQQTRKNQEQAIAKALLRQVEMELPETLIRQQVDYLLSQTASQLQNQGIDINQLFTAETVPRFREQTRGDAILSLKQSFALYEIAQQESITVEDAEIKSRMQAILQTAQDQNFDPDRLRDIVAEELLTSKVMDWLIEHSTVTLVPAGTLTGQQDSLNAPEVVETEMAELAVEQIAADVESTSESTAATPEDAETETPAAADADKAPKKAAPKGRKKSEVSEEE